MPSGVICSRARFCVPGPLPALEIFGEAGEVAFHRRWRGSLSVRLSVALSAWTRSIDLLPAGSGSRRAGRPTGRPSAAGRARSRAASGRPAGPRPVAGRSGPTLEDASVTSCRRFGFRRPPPSCGRGEGPHSSHPTAAYNRRPAGGKAEARPFKPRPEGRARVWPKPLAPASGSASQPNRRTHPRFTYTVLTSVYSSRAYSPSSRPMPLILKPPNGAAASNTS